MLVASKGRMSMSILPTSLFSNFRVASPDSSSPPFSMSAAKFEREVDSEVIASMSGLMSIGAFSVTKAIAVKEA